MRLLRDGLGKLGRRPATWVIFGLLAGMMLFIYIALGGTAPALTNRPGGAAVLAMLTFPQAYDAVLAFILGLGGLLAVIYGAAVMGSEWAWGTLKNAVARGESRTLYVIATFAAIAVVIGVGLVLATAVGVAAAFVGASLAGIPTEGATDAAAIMRLPEKLLRSWLGLAQAAAIGFAIATFARSQLAGIGAGLATYFGEQFSTLFFSDIVRFLPFHAAEAVSTVRPPGGLGDGPGAGLSAAQLGPDVALLVVAGWLLGALVASALATARAEITG